jgi:hypothetical protein
MRSVIYVSGPYTADPEKCTVAAIKVGDILLDRGYAPVVPHLSHYWHTQVTERDYEDWMAIDLALVERVDAFYRIPGGSSGADRERAHAESLGIPCFDSLLDLYSTIPPEQPVPAQVVKTDEPVPDETILEEAARIINGARRAQYGNAKDSFTNIAHGWSKIFEEGGVNPHTVLLAMVWLKTCRALQGFHRDSFVDIVGYGALAEEIQ